MDLWTIVLVMVAVAAAPYVLALVIALGFALYLWTMYAICLPFWPLIQWLDRRREAKAAQAAAALESESPSRAGPR